MLNIQLRLIMLIILLNLHLTMMVFLEHVRLQERQALQEMVFIYGHLMIVQM